MVEIGATIAQMVGSNAFGSVLYWVGYALLGIFILLAFGVAYYLLSFNYKVTVYPIYGSGKDGIFSVQRPKTNRVKWIRKQTAWAKLWPLFNRKEIEPFDAEFIYPGKRILAFELNNEWIPGRVNINESEGQLRAEINPVPYFVRNWQGLQYQKNAAEYANPGFWEENKQFILAIATVLICCVTMLVAIYFTYKYLAPGRADLAAFTSALKSAGTVPALGPH